MNRKRTMTTSKNADDDDDGDEVKLKQFNSYNKPRRNGNNEAAEERIRH